MKKTQINQVSFTHVRLQVSMQATTGPFPELMQPPNPASGSFREAFLWRQHVRGACSRWRWEVLGRRGLSEAIFALAVPAWHRTAHRTVY